MNGCSDKSITRRRFITQSASAGIVLSGAARAVTDSNEEESGGFVSEKSQAIMDRYDLKYPIFQAAPGGEALAVAVASSGAMGAVSLSWDTPEHAARVITRMNQATRRNYYANFVLHFEPAMLDAALQAGCPIVQFSWGIPSEDIVNKIRSAGAQLGIQVSSPDNAGKAMERAPDFLICQGLEAGGHVQATSPLEDSVQGVLDAAGETPVLLAGGISTGKDIRAAVDTGAAGAVLGTRFMATQESDAHDVYKQCLLDAGEDSTSYSLCFNRDWNAMHRVLRNSTLRKWEAEGCPGTGNKPGEDDEVADHPVFGPAMRYETIPPMQGHEGALEEMAMYAGEGVAAVNDLPTAGELIERLWNEYQGT